MHTYIYIYMHPATVKQNAQHRAAMCRHTVQLFPACHIVLCCACACPRCAPLFCAMLFGAVSCCAILCYEAMEPIYEIADMEFDRVIWFSDNLFCASGPMQQVAQSHQQRFK